MKGPSDIPDSDGADNDGGALPSDAVIEGSGTGRVSGNREFFATEDFRSRVGCGVVAAVGLPTWFGVLALALGRDQSFLGFAVAATLFAVSLLVAVPALRRMRRLPERVEFDGTGWMHLSGRKERMSLPVATINRIEVGALSGMGSIRIHTQDGRKLRVPDLDDVDGLIAAVVAANPGVEVVDGREPSDELTDTDTAP